MNLIIVSCLSHFVELTTSEQFDGRVFRGVDHSDAHCLRPPIGRSPRWSKLSLSRLTALERGMLKRFQQEGAPFAVGSLTEWEWLVLARSHGLPGRLLGWSRNPLVALYFAVQGGNERAGAVYAERFTRVVQGSNAGDPFAVKRVALLNPARPHPGSFAQEFVFTVHPDPRQDYRSKTLLCLRISGKLKGHIKQALRRLGIRPATIHLGLDGVAADICS